MYAFGLMSGADCCDDEDVLLFDRWTGLRLGGLWLGSGGASEEDDLSLTFPGSSKGSSK